MKGNDPCFPVLVKTRGPGYQRFKMAARSTLGHCFKLFGVSMTNGLLHGQNLKNATIKTSARLLALNVPAKPRKTALSSYQIFMKEQLDRRGGKDVSQAHLFKEIAEEWRSLDEERKDHYRARSDIEKESWMKECAVYEAYLDSLSEVDRTRIELKELLLKADSKERKRITREAVDDTALKMPKRPGSIFQLFLADEIREGNFHGLNGPGLFQAASEKWKTVQEHEKEELRRRRRELYKKYQEDLEVWKNS